MPLNFKFLTSGQSLDDALTVSQTLRGESLKPLAPVSLKASRNTAGDLLIEWRRRSRFGIGLQTSHGVPLGEESQVYLVEIYNLSGVLKRGNIIVRPGSARGFSSPVIWQILKNVAGSVTTNGVGGFSYADSTFLVAESLQRPLTDGMGVEFTVTTANDYLPADFGIGPVGVAGDYTFGGSVPEGMNQLLIALGSTVTAVAWPGALFSSVMTKAASDRFAIELKDGSVYYYKNGTLFFTSAVNPSTFTMQSAIRIVDTNDNTGITRACESAVVYQSTSSHEVIPSYTYNVAQQTGDFGSVQSTVRVRVYQISSIVGVGPYVQADL